MKTFFALTAIALMGLVSTASAVELTRNHLTANQWVRPTAQGGLNGRVVLPTANGQSQAVALASIALTDADGVTVVGASDAEGKFSFDNVKPGVYSMTVRGKDVFSCGAMHVVDPTDQRAAGYPDQAEVAVAGVDFTMVKMAIVRYLPPSTTSAVSIAEADLEKLSPQVNGEDFSRVAQTDGGMDGRIHLAGAKGGMLDNGGLTNVFIIRNGAEVARTVTDASGKFRVDNLAAGEYSVLAVGPSGLALTGFELIDETQITKTASVDSTDGYTYVTFGGDNCCCCPTFAVQCAPAPQVVQCVEEVICAQPVEEVIISDQVVSEQVIGEAVVADGFGTPVAPGGFGGYAGGGGYGGFGGGGGGFGGFGGGLGGLAALAGIGGVIAAVAADDDNNNNFVPVPTPVSPIR